MSIGTPAVLPPRSMTQPRHALGLPAGSVRALLALMVLGLLAVIVFTGQEKDQSVETLYIYLWAMLFLIVAHYFTVRSHMARIQQPGPHPLGLPRGSVRLILIVGMAAIVAWLWHHDRLFDEPPKTISAGLLLLIPCGFLVGWFLTRCVHVAFGAIEPYWYQDIQAWFALVAMALLLIDLLLMLINTQLSPDMRRDLRLMEAALTAIVSFYFGARS